MLALFLSAIVFTSCSKDKDRIYTANFQPEDFKIIITKKQLNTDNYYITFEVKNLKNESYESNSDDGYWRIRFKLKTTDGAEYIDEPFIENMSANGSSINNARIHFPEGKTVSEASLAFDFFDANK